MIEQILAQLAAGEEVNLDDQAFVAAIQDRAFRVELVTAVAEAMGLSDQLDFDRPDVKMLIESPDHIPEFLQAMQMMTAMGEQMEAGLQPSSEPVATDPDSRPAPRNVAPDELDAAIERVNKSFFVSHAFSDTASVEGDMFVLPNAELAKFEVTWTKIITPAGDVDAPPIDPDEPFAGLSSDMDGNLGQSVPKGDLEDEQVRGLRGGGSVTVPIAFDSVQFDGIEPQTKPVGAASATLESCQNDCVALAVTDLPRDVTPIVIARDSDGVRLRQNESMSQTRNGWKASIRFTGVVASLEVFVARESATRALNIVATREPASDAEGNYPPIAAPRYAKPRPTIKLENISEQALKDGIEIRAGRLASSFEFNHPAVRCCLPAIGNSALATVEFGEATVKLTAGDPSECETSGRGYNAAKFCHSISFDRGGEPPEGFNGVSGTVTITYPLEGRIITLNADNPEQDGVRLEIDGNKVSLTVEDDDVFGLNWLTGGWSDDPLRIDPIDETGLSLRKLSHTSWHSNTLVQGYWGQPVAVRVMRITRHTTLEIPYDLKPAPPLDPELAGRPGADS